MRIFLFGKSIKAGHLTLGETGEKLVVKYMGKIGLEVLRINYRVHGVGEIDIIGRDGSCLVFVEVKTRTNSDRSRPGEAVNHEKQNKLWKASRTYLRELGNPKIRFRFDVAEVYYQSRFKNRIVYLPNAFSAENIRKDSRFY